MVSLSSEVVRSSKHNYLLKKNYFVVIKYATLMIAKWFLQQIAVSDSPYMWLCT